MKAFVDANYFIALANRKDTNHERAKRMRRTVWADNMQIVISNFVFAEIVTVASQRVNREAALDLGKSLFADSNVTMVTLNDSAVKRTWHYFQQITKKNMGFVDCSILAVMEAENIAALLTFDRKDFAPLQKTYGFRLL